MALELWIGNGGHWFFDADFGVQVGQAYERPDGSWGVEIGDEVFAAPDLETAKRVFVERYDPKYVQPGPLSSDGELDEDGFEVIRLT